MEPIRLTERLGRWSSGRGPLYVLLAARLRRLIDEGELPAGALLPPDRALASALAVGRSTVVAAYELLREEGRITRRQGSGTRVAGAVSAARSAITAAPVFLHLLEPRDDVIMLACAAPDHPPAELVEAYGRMVPDLRAVRSDIGYHPAGHLALRQAIADRYVRRGVPTEPAQILVTNGGQQALTLISRAFLRPGDRVLVEAPTYPGVLEVLREEETVPRPLPIGLTGFDAAVREHRPALAYVVPTFHNPTGSVLSSLIRRRLAESAATAGVPLIEDEVLADLGFSDEEPPQPLAAYGGTVISVGSLSKIAWGGLRIGWVRAAEPTITRLERLRAVYDLGGNVPAQLAAAHLLPRLGAVRRRRARDLLVRHDHLRAELARHLPGWDAPAVPGGQTLWVRLPHGDGTSFAQIAMRRGVAVLPGAGLDVSGRSDPYVRLHFLLPTDELSEAVRRLAEAWSTYHGLAKRATSLPVMAV